VIIEDKVGLKKNSLFGTDVIQNQDTIKHFSQKIRAGKKAQITNDFMIIARIESFILDKGLRDAIERARAYIDAGADGILIHSRAKTPDEIFAFCAEYKQFAQKVPLYVVPTSYNSVTEDELINAGVNVVIYANHLIRAAYPAMVQTAKSILTHQRSFEADTNLMSINECIELIPGSK
jgi:phosphoenolpyruvate phosphomutase